MKFNIIKKTKKELSKDVVNINIEYNNATSGIEDFVKYIQDYNNNILIKNDNTFTIEGIKYSDILYFFSENKFNYCKTLKDTYKIKSKLYEIENLSLNFMRISKKCIVNVEHIKNFDISESGKIKVNLDNGDSELASRRRMRDIIEFFDERRI